MTATPAYPSFAEHCTVCGSVTELVCKHRAVRETFSCVDCGASLRYRAQAAAILSHTSSLLPRKVDCIADLAKTPAWKSINVYEPGIIGPFRKLFEVNANYTKSFFWEDVPVGQSINGIVCQDLTRTTYESEKFDLVITSDIFEHVRKPMAGFTEVRRILRTGGAHVFSVPAQEPLREKSLSRVDTSGPLDVYILDAVYHGSGDGGRSLVYTEFGKDIVADLGRIGMETYIHRYASKSDAVPAVFTFVSVKLEQ